MNVILKLLDPEFVNAFFQKELLRVLPEMSSIKSIVIEPVKKNIWNTTYHTVFRYITTFIDQQGQVVVWPIYCSAHSSEPRRNVFEVLEFLWQSSFSQDGLTIPKPLFYSDEFRAVFYRGVEGKILYHSIKEKNLVEIENGVIRSAAWLAKLHSLSAKGVKNFNPENSRIATVLPGFERIIKEMKVRYPQYTTIYEKMYHLFSLREESFLAVADRHWLIHGDVHPENIIITPSNKTAFIDFADFCISDFARDLGTQLQQLEYMANRNIGDSNYVEKLKKLFLNSYYGFAKVQPDDSLEARIANYYNWTAARTANYFLFKHNPSPESAKPLLELVCKNLNLKFNI